MARRVCGAPLLDPQIKGPPLIVQILTQAGIHRVVGDYPITRPSADSQIYRMPSNTLESVAGMPSSVLPEIKTQPVILMIEDDPNDAALAERAFKEATVPHWLIRLHDGEQAIKYLGRQPPYTDPDVNPLPVLILLDLKMPKITGLEVLAWLRTQPKLAAIPVVILTGSVLETDRADAQKLGAAAYEVKPLSFKALLEIIQGIGTRWLDRPVPSP